MLFNEFTTKKLKNIYSFFFFDNSNFIFITTNLYPQNWHLRFWLACNGPDLCNLHDKHGQSWANNPPMQQLALRGYQLRVHCWCVGPLSVELRDQDAPIVADTMHELKCKPLPPGATAHDRFPGTAPRLDMLTKINKCYRVAAGVKIDLVSAE